MMDLTRRKPRSILMTSLETAALLVGISLLLALIMLA